MPAPGGAAAVLQDLRAGGARGVAHLRPAPRWPAHALGAGLEQRRERPETLPAAVTDDRSRRAALFHPAVIERDLLAKRADVDEVLAVGRVTHRAFAHQERPLADRTRARGNGCLRRDTHDRGTLAEGSQTFASSGSFCDSAITFCAMCEGTSS